MVCFSGKLMQQFDHKGIGFAPAEYLEYKLPNRGFLFRLPLLWSSNIDRRIQFEADDLPLSRPGSSNFPELGGIDNFDTAFYILRFRTLIAFQ